MIFLFKASGAPQALSHWYSEIRVTKTDENVGNKSNVSHSNELLPIHKCHAKQNRTLKILSEDVKMDNF